MFSVLFSFTPIICRRKIRRGNIYMATATISIDVDPETARAYAEASEEQRRELKLLLKLKLRLRELTVNPARSLTQIMDEMGQKQRHAA